MTFTNLRDARNELQAGIKDQVEESGMDPDEFVPDLIDSMRTECEPEVFGELCRTEMGWIPSASRRELAKTPRGRLVLEAEKGWMS